MPRFAVETPQQLDWTSCSYQLIDPFYPLPPSGDDPKELTKESISARRCCKCRAIIVRRAWQSRGVCVMLGKSHTDAVLSRADCSHCESLSLAFLRSRIAFFSESDSAPPVFFLSRTCEEKITGQRIRAAGDKRALLNARVPRRHCRESICRSSSLSMISVPPRLRVTWSVSVGVTVRWMTAFLWQLIGLCDWGTHPYHDKGCQWARARVVYAWGAISQQSGRVVSPPTAPPTRLASVLLPPLPSPPLTALKRRYTSACPFWMSPWPRISAHFCTRWTHLLGGWTSGFGASHYGCAPGLPDKDARQWGGRSRCSFTQAPEERDRPGPTHHQSHHPGHRAVNVQPGSVGMPPLAHDDGDERGRQGSLPQRFGLVRQPVWTSCGGLCGTLHKFSEVDSGNAKLPPETHQLCCFQSP